VIAANLSRQPQKTGFISRQSQVVSSEQAGATLVLEHGHCRVVEQPIEHRCGQHQVA
jgi:hypothetical protein